MESRGIEWKVGLFLAVGIVLAGMAIMRFGKLERSMRDSYEIIGIFNNSGGIVPDAQVVCAGVPVGHVREVRLYPEGRHKVHIVLDIYRGTKIRRGAELAIKQVGFLGDKYVEIIPAQDPKAPVVEPGARLQGRDPFDMNEAALEGVALLETSRRIADRLDRLLVRLDETILREERLRQLDDSFGALAETAEDVRETARVMRESMDRAGPGLADTVEVFASLTNDVKTIAKDAGELIAESKKAVARLSAQAEDLAGGANDVMERIAALLDSLEEGEGTVGRLLTDSSLYDEAVTLLRRWREQGILSKEKLSNRRLKEREETLRRGRIRSFDERD